MSVTLSHALQQSEQVMAQQQMGAKGSPGILPPLSVIISIVNQLTRAILPSDAWSNAPQLDSRSSLPLSGAAGHSHPPTLSLSPPVHS